MPQEKVQAALQLVQEQLEQGHLEPSTSPWNTPIFVIKKKNGDWRLLQDLREVNKTMMPMGALQPGLPSPVAIPKGFHKIVIDIKNCFFSIPLHPADCKRFAFSIPIINHAGPNPRFQWRVLPQGMANSPTLCQRFVAQSVNPIRLLYPTAYILHYTDDVLIAADKIEIVNQIAQDLVLALQDRGFIISPEKIQTCYPFLFLGFQLDPTLIHTQKIHIKRTKLSCLNDFQKLLGDINWLRPYLRLTTGDLKPLFNILQGDPDPSSPRSLTPDAEASLVKVEEAISQQGMGYFDPAKILYLLVFNTDHMPSGLLWQEEQPLLWVHAPATSSKVLPPYPFLVNQILFSGIKTAVRYFGRDPDVIVTPYSGQQIAWLQQRHDEWAVLLAGFHGKLDTHMPGNKLIQFLNITPFTFLKNTCLRPIPNALLVFIDGSKNGKASYVINDKAYSIDTPYRSAQMVELYAAFTIFQLIRHQEFNLFSDSQYVVRALQVLEMVPTIQPSTPTFQLFSKIQRLIRDRSYLFFVGHIRAHSGLPGPLTRGNELADKGTRLVASVSLQDPVKEAQAAHLLHHLNASTLRLRFGITREQARQIVKNCKNCVTLLPEPQWGVNPRGLIPGELWQMDVTHIPSFGKLKYVHVTIDTYSGFLYASAQTGEATKQVIAHLFLTFSAMGQPKTLKTDNGPGYTSQKFKQFCAQLKIKHYTGIPYNPQGQGIVERANQTLKHTIFKLMAQETLYPIKGNAKIILAHALFVLNFLTLDNQGRSAADRLWHPSTQSNYAQALWKDPLSGAWAGPDPVLIWGKGHACIYDTKAQDARWLPERLIKLYNPTRENKP